MVENWEELENAIQNLKNVRDAKSKDLLRLRKYTLLGIEEEGKKYTTFYIVEETDTHTDWAEYKLKNILTNEIIYLEIDEGEKLLWKKLPKSEAAQIIKEYHSGKFYVIDRGKTKDYEYTTFTLTSRKGLYSIETYKDGETEVYKSIKVDKISVI